MTLLENKKNVFHSPTFMVPVSKCVDVPFLFFSFPTLCLPSEQQRRRTFPVSRRRWVRWLDTGDFTAFTHLKWRRRGWSRYVIVGVHCVCDGWTATFQSYWCEEERGAAAATGPVDEGAPKKEGRATTQTFSQCEWRHYPFGECGWGYLHANRRNYVQPHFFKGQKHRSQKYSQTVE